LRKNSDSVEQSHLYSVGALIESIDYRGRAALSAPRASCLSGNAGLQGPLSHGSERSIEVFPKRTFPPGIVFFQLLCSLAERIAIKEGLAPAPVSAEARSRIHQA
jgi:hypothetical protein